MAVVIINGQDGVQSHTRTIWKCLEHYHVPVTVFVNKMDISHLSREQLMKDLRKHCSDMCVDYRSENAMEEMSLADDAMLEMYSDTGTIPHQAVVDAVYERKIFPVFFGSALKLEGIEDLLDGLVEMVPERTYPEKFGARVYKISEDASGERLTHVKITGGSIAARAKLSEEDKIDQIRIYQGKNFEAVKEAEAGDIVSFKGVHGLEAGDGLGFESDSEKPLLNAYMNYELILPAGANPLAIAEAVKKIAEEDPQLEISMDEKTKRIELSIMGKMQMEVLQKRILAETGIDVGFGTGSIVYQETIGAPVDGAGHFEPLRHYAEVHVRLEPLPAGSGIQVVSALSTDVLNASWQRSILSSLQRKRHRGVLIGAPLTDVKIILTAGRANNKHTSGGDMREAACRAVRQALMKADNVLLEPYYDFTLAIPSASLSRALYDLEERKASVRVEEEDNGEMVVSGHGPVRTMINYQSEVTAYTKGLGRFSCTLKDYEPSRAQAELVEAADYDPESDLRNPCGSVFCAHGAGYYVPWDQADDLMHIQLKADGSEASSYKHERISVSNEDLQDILQSAGSNNRSAKESHRTRHEPSAKKVKASPNLPGLLIVDGYNMIFSWDSLHHLGREDLSAARTKLLDILANYQAYTGIETIVVFDGYKVHDNIGTHIDKGKFHVIYTREEETADAWIEKAGYEYGKKYTLSVATSDALIQNAVFSQGALRVSARELEDRIAFANRMITEKSSV
jgi:ribosomal protection tetracycline resistance protein